MYRPILILAAGLACGPVAAFTLAECDTVRGREDSLAALGPATELPFFVDPGQVRGEVTCWTQATATGTAIFAQEPVPEGPSGLTFEYRPEQVLMLIDDPEGGLPLRLAQCGVETAGGYACGVDLMPEALLNVSRVYRPGGTAPETLFRVFTSTFLEDEATYTRFFETPLDRRSVRLRVAGVPGPIEMTLMSNGAGYEITDAQLRAAVIGALESGEGELELTFNVQQSLHGWRTIDGVRRSGEVSARMMDLFIRFEALVARERGQP